ncbi:hypothetical protein VE02_08386 [Pseudogymnoascus sp. 03VT05]|nr:hypothetical protein VE02_08386 [Pseudogymnoascus sp. 03VT05]
MVIFKSPHVDIEVPEHITTWEWAFEREKYSPLCKVAKEPPGAFIDAITGKRLDFAQLKTKATQLCTALTRNHDFRVGDTVTIFSTNTIWYPVALWAVSRGGGRVNGASPAYNAEEMSYALKTAKARFLITLPKTLDVALAAAKKSGIPLENIFLLEGQADGVTSIQSLIEIGAQYAPSPPFKIPKDKSNKGVCGFLTFSSGTTGLPKAVE